MIELLESAHFLLVCLDVTSDDENGPTIDLSIHNAGHRMHDSWPTYYKTDSGSSSEITVCLGSIARTLLIPESNESNSQINAGFGNLNYGNPDNSEYGVDLQRSQCLRCNLSTAK